MATIHLNDAEKAFIDEQVKAGSYHDAEELIRAGLRLLRNEHREFAELRRKIDEADQQIADGKGIEVDNVDDLARSIVDRGRKILGQRG